MKLRLNQSEAATLAMLLMGVDYQVIDNWMLRNLTRHHIRGLVRKLANKIENWPAKKESRLTLNKPDTAALYVAIMPYLGFQLGVYEQNLVMKIAHHINQIEHNET